MRRRSTEQRELIYEISSLYLLIGDAPDPEIDALPGVDALLESFAAALKEPEPAADKLRAARDAFYALPEATQRRLLKGWSPFGPKPLLADLFGQMRHQSAARVLVFMTPPACAPEQRLAFAHDVRPAGGHAAVRVEVTEGTTENGKLRLLIAFETC